MYALLGHTLVFPPPSGLSLTSMRRFSKRHSLLGWEWNLTYSVPSLSWLPLIRDAVLSAVSFCLRNRTIADTGSSQVTDCFSQSVRMPFLQYGGPGFHRTWCLSSIRDFTSGEDTWCRSCCYPTWELRQRLFPVPVRVLKQCCRGLQPPEASLLRSWPGRWKELDCCDSRKQRAEHCCLQGWFKSHFFWFFRFCSLMPVPSRCSIS